MPDAVTQTVYHDFQDQGGAYLHVLQFWHGAFCSCVICERCGCRYEVRYWVLHKKRCKPLRKKVQK